MTWAVAVALAYSGGMIALVLAWMRSRAATMERAVIEAAIGGYTQALDHVKKRLCPWCREGEPSHKGANVPWRHMHGRAARKCRASWVRDHEWRYLEAARKLAGAEPSLKGSTGSPS